MHSVLKLEKEVNVVLIYLVESYCNRTHSDPHSFHLSTGKPIQNTWTSIGQSLISIQSIMKDGPLCNFDVIKWRPIDEIKWKYDTPHVDSTHIKSINEAAATLPLTSEIICLSNSYTGDYHDDMNGNMFMKWITAKVIPLTARNYTGMQMVPVMENALYHHVCSIQSLASFSKKITVKIMKLHGIDYMLLLLTDEKISILPEQMIRCVCGP